MIRKILILIFVSILLAGCITGQPAEKSTLQLTSSPSGAEIYLDNQYRGSTPSTIAGIEPGSHILEMRMGGYKSWKAVVTVQPGTSNYTATLTAFAGSQQPGDISTVTTTEPVAVTIKTGRDRMIVGDSNLFFGTATGTSSVALTLFGSGHYENGVMIADQVKTDSVSAWSYTWNPGTKIQSGTYTIIAENLQKTASSRATFTVIGDGFVSVTPSRYAVSRGEVLVLSGRCTTGAPNVRVVVFGPDKFASGVDLGNFPVMADQTWSMRYTTDLTMPAGVYSVYVSDVPQTATGSTQLTIGFAD